MKGYNKIAKVESNGENSGLLESTNRESNNEERKFQNVRGSLISVSLEIEYLYSK